VSRGTVREALRHLQQEGLVTAGARGTLRVHMHSPAEIRELYQVRAALEGLAVTLLTASQQRENRCADASRGSLEAR
jgi:DNA-binding GntR family transcriptional regulator